LKIATIGIYSILKGDEVNCGLKPENW